MPTSFDELNTEIDAATPKNTDWISTKVDDELRREIESTLEKIRAREDLSGPERQGLVNKLLSKVCDILGADDRKGFLDFKYEDGIFSSRLPF